MAPSSLHVSPLAYGFQIIALTVSANSGDCPNLFRGTDWRRFSNVLPCKPLPIGVWKIPGAMVITLIPNFPKSLAIGRVIPMMAPFDAEQMLCPFCPSNPATLATLISTPRSPSMAFCSDIILAPCLHMLKVPITLILSTRSISQEEATPLEQMSVPAAITPAQLTTAWICPCFCLICSNKAITFCSLLTSVLKYSPLIY